MTLFCVSFHLSDRITEQLTLLGGGGGCLEQSCDYINLSSLRHTKDRLRSSVFTHL